MTKSVSEVREGDKILIEYGAEGNVVSVTVDNMIFDSDNNDILFFGHAKNGRTLSFWMNTLERVELEK